jgi:hypothetical protein
VSARVLPPPSPFGQNAKWTGDGQGLHRFPLTCEFNCEVHHSRLAVRALLRGAIAVALARPLVELLGDGDAVGLGERA